jgi:hypothetical protein
MKYSCVWTDLDLISDMNNGMTSFKIKRLKFLLRRKYVITSQNVKGLLTSDHASIQT